MRRLLVAGTLALSVALGLSGCRDYDRFLEGPGLDGAMADLGEIGDGAALDGSGGCEATPDFAVGSVIGHEQTVLLPAETGNPLNVVHARVRSLAVDVAAVTFGNPSVDPAQAAGRVTLLAPVPGGNFATVVPAAPLLHGATAVTAGALSANQDGIFTLYDCLAPGSTGLNANCGMAQLKWNGSTLIEASTLSFPGARPLVARVADIDHDGNGDLVVASATQLTATGPPWSGGRIDIYYGDGSAVLQSPRAITIGSGIAFPSALGVGDFDGNGTKDIIVYGSTSNGTPKMLEVFVQNTSGTFAERSGTAVLAVNPLDVNDVMSLIVADLEGDGTDEVLFGGRNDAPAYPRAITVLRKNPTGPSFIASHIPTAGLVHGLAAVDWNGDGQLDVFAWIQQSAMLSAVDPTLFLNLGAGNFDERPAPMWRRTSVVVNPTIASPDVVATSCGPALVFTDGQLRNSDTQAQLSTFTR